MDAQTVLALRCMLLLALLALSTGDAAIGGDWPQWRGPAGTGVSDETNVPIIWSENRNVAWKCTLPEWGTSTPAIWKDAVFVTSASEDGKLLLLKIDKRSGEISWTREVGRGKARREGEVRSRQKFHQLHNLASPSPVTNGKQVVAHFGNGDLAVYDFDGNQIWHRNLEDDYGTYSIWWGHANSPVLFGGQVISICLQDSLEDVSATPAKSYVVAHDLRDGHVKWMTDRRTDAEAEQYDAYTTPLLVTQGDRTELIVMGGNQLDAYDPLTGEQLWYLPGIVGGRTITGPTAADGLVFATRGMRGDLLAVDPSGAGKLSRRSIKWKYGQGTPDTCCPVVWKKWIFTISDDGVARCLDANRGHLKWKSRLQGKYKASPIAANGRVYFLNTEGVCTVVSASARFDRLTENQVDAQTIASPAISDGRIYLRGRSALYCIADSTNADSPTVDR